MGDHNDETPDPPLTDWEQSVVDELERESLPRWDQKARAALFAQGHRGLLDLELDFPEEYLKGPAPLCFVWKIAVEDGQRVHAYADVEGGCYHLRWDDEDESTPQNQPVHLEGGCETRACKACGAARRLSSRLDLRLS